MLDVYTGILTKFAAGRRKEATLKLGNITV